MLLHYPIASFRDIPAAFARPYPVGRENLSLHELLHARIRAFGDPRVHAAIVPAAVSAPKLRAYTGPGLQSELDRQMCDFLGGVVHSPRAGQPLVVFPRIVRWFAGDFPAPARMPCVHMLGRGQL